jgi:hypothetical protein
MNDNNKKTLQDIVEEIGYQKKIFTFDIFEESSCEYYRNFKEFLCEFYTNKKMTRRHLIKEIDLKVGRLRWFCHLCDNVESVIAKKFNIIYKKQYTLNLNLEYRMYNFFILRCSLVIKNDKEFILCVCIREERDAHPIEVQKICYLFDKEKFEEKCKEYGIGRQ